MAFIFVFLRYKKILIPKNMFSFRLGVCFWSHSPNSNINIFSHRFCLPFGWHLYEIHGDSPLASLSFFFSLNTLIRLSLIEMHVPLSGALHPPPRGPCTAFTQHCRHSWGQWGGGGPLNPDSHLSFFPSHWCALQMSTFVLNKKSYCFFEKTSATARFWRHEKESPPPPLVFVRLSPI